MTNLVIRLTNPECGHHPICGCKTAIVEVGKPVCCLECPFVSCVFDVVEDNHSNHNFSVLKAETVIYMYIEGAEFTAIADRLNITLRTVRRMWAKYLDN